MRNASRSKGTWTGAVKEDTTVVNLTEKMTLN